MSKHIGANVGGDDDDDDNDDIDVDGPGGPCRQPRRVPGLGADLFFGRIRLFVGEVRRPLELPRPRK